MVQRGVGTLKYSTLVNLVISKRGHPWTLYGRFIDYLRRLSPLYRNHFAFHLSRLIVKTVFSNRFYGGGRGDLWRLVLPLG